MSNTLRWTHEQLAAWRAKPAGARRIARQTSLATLASVPQEAILRDSIVSAGLPEPYREFTWHPTRGWRLDLAWPERRLAIEIDGGVHRIRDKFARDIERHNTLTLAGWRYIRVSPDQVRTGEALELVRQLLA
ncbi:MAG: DUF559 domain-containing protein [Burkholderiales bacterium]|nr:DUF559 domain-containing protein [Burkholderiales bacterium]